MSKKYQEQIQIEEVVEMRKFCNRPGKRDENGKLVYLTQQSDKEKSNINNMLKKYIRTGVISRVKNFEAKYGDVTGIDFRQAMELIVGARESFYELPSDVRKRFDNNPEKLLTFMEDPNNREEAIRLGLIHKDTPEDMDGFGEHVVETEGTTKDE